MDQSDFWSRHVFILITPDAILRGVHTDFVARLGAELFPPVAAMLKKPDSDMLDELYEDVIAGQWQTWRYRMVDDAFALGSCLALICRYTGEHPDPHALMRQLKGNQHPEKTSPGELRHDFGAVNSIIGVMHASDNPGESAKDASIFGLTPSDAVAQQAGVAARICLLCTLTEPASPERRDFDAVLGGVRAQIITTFWQRFADDAAVAELSALMRGDAAALATPGAGDALLRLCDDRLPEEVLAVLACDFTPATRNGQRPADLFATLRRHGVELDQWQRVVLESSLYFPPARRQW